MKKFFGKAKSELEKKLGYTFRKKELLNTALMHRSRRFEEGDIDHDNERLEFLGDSILGLVSGAYLFKKFNALNEGNLTRLRSRMTNTKILAEIGASLELGEYIKLGKGEVCSGGKKRTSILANAMEAILGAAYIDGGINAAEKIFLKLFIPAVTLEPDDDWSDNPKGYLQMITQRKWRKNPVYRVVSEKGKPHEKIYTIEVDLNNSQIGRGVARSKREAEELAAQTAITYLEQEEKTNTPTNNAKEETNEINNTVQH